MRSGTICDVPADRRGRRPTRALASLLASVELAVHPAPPDRDVAIDLRPFVLDAELDDDGVLRFRLKMTPEGSARPEEVIDALGLRDLLDEGPSWLAPKWSWPLDRIESGPRPTPAAGADGAAS